MAFDEQKTLRNLKNRDWMKRAEAIRQLEVAGADSAVEDIADHLLTDDSLYVRAAAARTLGKLGSAEAVDALTKALSDDAFHVRQAAMWALGEIGAPAQPALDAMRPFADSVERFPQAELTVAEIANLVIGRIEGAVAEETSAQAAAPEGAPKIVLSPIDLMAAKKKGMTPEEFAKEKYGDAPAPAPAKKAAAPAAAEAAPEKPKVTLSPMDLMAAKKKGMTPEEYAAEKYGEAGAPAPAPAKKAAAPAAEAPAVEESPPASEKKAMSPAEMMKAKSGGGDAAPTAEKKAMSPAEMMKAKQGGDEAPPAAEKKAMSPADMMKAKSGEDAPAPAEKKAEPDEAPAGEKKAMSPAEMFKKKNQG
jgi:hypothetical protein